MKLDFHRGSQYEYEQPSPSKHPLRKSKKYWSGIFNFPIVSDFAGYMPMDFKKLQKRTSPNCIRYAWDPLYPEKVFPILQSILRADRKFLICWISFDTRETCRPAFRTFPSVAISPIAYAKFGDHFIFTFHFGFAPRFPMYVFYPLYHRTSRDSGYLL